MKEHIPLDKSSWAILDNSNDVQIVFAKKEQIDDAILGCKTELLNGEYCKPGDDLLWIINKWFKIEE